MCDVVLVVKESDAIEEAEVSTAGNAVEELGDKTSRLISLKQIL